MSADPIIRYAKLIGDDDETFDEFIANNATIHIEAMGRCSWWIGVTLADGRSWMLNLGAVNDRAKPFAICEADE